MAKFTVEELRESMREAFDANQVEAGFKPVYLDFAKNYTQEDVDRTFNGNPQCDLGSDFLGFCHTYVDAIDYLGDHPEINTVLDLGCAAGFQSYAIADVPTVYRYIGVDVSPYQVKGPVKARFVTDDIFQYIDKLNMRVINPAHTLVIMSYVPNTETLCPTLANLFNHRIIYYPGID